MQGVSAEIEEVHHEMKDTVIKEEENIFVQIKEEIINDVHDTEYGFISMKPLVTDGIPMYDKIKIEEQSGDRNGKDLEMYNNEENKENINVCEDVKQCKETNEIEVPRVNNNNNNFFNVCRLDNVIKFYEKGLDQFCLESKQFAEKDDAVLKSDERIIQDYSLKCSLCSFSCENEETLKIHFKIHSKCKPYQCHRCSYGCYFKVDLESHMLLHDETKLLDCTICDNRCTSKVRMAHHSTTHNADQPYGCPFCPYTSSTTSALKLHLKNHTAECPFECSQCSFKAIKKVIVKNHIFTEHPREAKPKQCLTYTKCNESLSTQYYFTDHAKEHTGQSAFYCSHCPYNTTHGSSLASHMVKHTTREFHYCNACPKVFMKKTMLEKHIADKHFCFRKSRLFQCSFCTFACASKDALDVHERRHSHKSRYQCPECLTRFSQKKVLEDHQKTNRYACHLCSFMCCAIPALVGHMKSHVAERS